MRIHDMLNSSEDRPLYEQIIFSLIYSYIIYMLSSIFLGKWKPLVSFSSLNNHIQMQITTEYLIVLVVIVTTVVSPIIFSLLKHRDIPMKWLRGISATSKSSMPNTWLDTFHNEKRIIQIYLKDERIIRGWPHRYSSTPEDGFVYIVNPCWVNTEKKEESENDYFETNAHGFLIPLDQIDFVEFSLKANEDFNSISEGDWND